MLPARAMVSLLRTPWAQRLMSRVLGLYLAFALRTTRWLLDGEEHLAAQGSQAPAVFAFWHEFLPVMPELAVLARRLPQYSQTAMYTLVSHHRDGRFIGEVIGRFKIYPVSGSTSRGGVTGQRNLLRLLANGSVISITPDGPRGPPRAAAPGVAQVAALAGVPVVPCAARTSRRIVLATWDRMAIPLPFGRGVMVCGPAIAVSRTAWRDAVPAIASALDRAAERADQLCLT
jgi:lysophospholipid acyltransferase (LPLAT)-like uncharacterized protein